MYTLRAHCLCAFLFCAVIMTACTNDEHIGVGTEDISTEVTFPVNDSSTEDVIANDVDVEDVMDVSGEILTETENDIEDVCQKDEDCVDVATSCQEAHCSDGICLFTDLPDGSLCSDDGVLCLTCAAGVCREDLPAKLDDENPCTEDSCVKGKIVHQPSAAPNQCDDGDPCTTQDTCFLGTCKGGPQVQCTQKPCASSTSCQAGECTSVWNPVGTVCDDGNPCTENVCDEEHTCVTIEMKNCDDGNICTNDTCDPNAGGCAYMANTVLCDDGNACTVDDVCLDTVCTAGSLVMCNDDDICNGTETCDPVTGCTNGTALVCNDNVDCTIDTCSASAGCVFTPNDANCDDGDDCTTDTCDPTLGCQHDLTGDPESCCATDDQCDDGIVCTIDICDDTTGCIHTPDDNLCTDGDVCNGTETCSPTNGCVSGTDLDCDDSIPCTIDSCDTSLGCVYLPEDLLCDDDDVCNGAETCDPIAGCLSGAPSGACNDQNTVPWDGCNQCEIVEFQVNTYTSGDQRRPDVAGFSDGGYVVVWDSDGQDGSGYGVYGQRYQADGSEDGNEFQIHQQTLGHQWFTTTSMLADNNFVVAFSTGASGGTNPYEAVILLYSQNGEVNTGELQVNTYTSGNQWQPDVTRLSNGGFATTWQSYGQDGNVYGIFARVYDNTGVPTAGEFLVNQTIASDQADCSVANLPNGTFAVAWNSPNQDGSGHGVFARLFTDTGSAAGDEFLVNTFTADSQTEPALDASADGTLAVVWQSNGQDGAGWAIAARIFDSSGTPQGDDFVINTTTAGNQRHPQVAFLENGEFVVVWEGPSGIFFQRHSATGTKLGAEEQVNIFTGSGQTDPNVAALNSGGFVLVWSSPNQDGSGYGIYAQRFDTEGNRIYY